MTPAADYDRSEFKSHPEIQSVNAVSLATHDMAGALEFYQAIGFTLRYGGERSSFSSLSSGSSFINLIAQPPDRTWSWWRRVIL